MRADFPDTVDSTMRGAWSSCEKKFHYEFIHQIAPQGVNRDLHAGGCFAAGMCATRRAYYELHKDSDLAIGYGIVAIIKEWGTVDDFDDYVKSFNRVVFALLYYFEQYPLETDIIRPLEISPGKFAIEVSFALPMEIKHPTTGNPILYSGRFDMIGVRDGILFVVDEKTTKQLGPTWSNNWTLRSQFTGYVHGAKSYGHQVAGAIIRGVSFLKGGNETQQAIIYRPDWQIQRWWDQLHRDVEGMIKAWLSGIYDYNLDTACNYYGGCPFMRLCDSANPEAFIDLYYQERKWDPLHRGAE